MRQKNRESKKAERTVATVSCFCDFLIRDQDSATVGFSESQRSLTGVISVSRGSRAQPCLRVCCNSVHVLGGNRNRDTLEARSPRQRVHFVRDKHIRFRIVHQYIAGADIVFAHSIVP